MGEFTQIKEGVKETHLIANFADADRKCYYTRATKILQDVQGLVRFSNLDITYDGSEELTGGRTLKHYTVMLLK
jgi:hypothetical protein